MVTDDDIAYERAIADRIIQFNSYLWWSRVFSQFPDSPYASYWINADAQGYRNHLGGSECQFCGDWHIIYPNKEVDEYPIIKAYCLCELLPIMQSIGSKDYESYFDYRARLSQILPIDVPPGAAKDTRMIVANCVNWLQKPTKWMLLTGGTGTAKSHILFALRRRMGGLGYYITASDLVQKLGAAVKKGGTDDILNELIHTPFLFIDDFGMDHQGQGKYGINMIAHILDQRYLLKNRAPVVMATNLTLDELYQDDTKNQVRIGSRMMDSDLSIVNVFTQADFRLKETKDAARLK